MTNFRKMQPNADYSNRVMEAETIQKNGASLKSHMSKGNFKIKPDKKLGLMLILILGLIILSSSLNAQTVEEREDNSAFSLELYNMGAKYEKGKGVKKNIDSAIVWYLKAAAKDYLPAVEKLKELDIAVSYRKIRYNSKYFFRHNFTNHSNYSLYLQDSNVKSKEQYDYNKSPDFPKFRWTDEITEQKGEIKPFQRIPILIAKTAYNVIAHPPKRAYDNLLLIYTVSYSRDKKGWKKWQNTHYTFYEITWCGDGILDTDEDEECDDGNSINGDGCDCNCKKE